MSKKNGNKRSNQHQNNGAFSPPSQNVALGLVKRRFPELFSNALTDVRLTQMTSEEKTKWEKEWIHSFLKEWRKRWKEDHIDDIKHSGDFWKLDSVKDQYDA